MNAPGITCLVPAHNEAPRIGRVIAAVQGHPAVDDLMIVDDGSTDGTGDVARAAGALVISGPGNSGKTRALMLGLARVRTSHVLFLDADLLGLGARDISALVAPVTEGRAAASISLRGNAPRTWRALGVDYISGERLIPVDLLAGQEIALAALPRFGFEVFLNRLLIARDDPVAIVRWPGVSSPSKARKRGLFRGAVGDATMILDILRTIPPGQIVSQITALRRLHRRSMASDAVLPPSCVEVDPSLATPRR